MAQQKSAKASGDKTKSSKAKRGRKKSSKPSGSNAVGRAANGTSGKKSVRGIALTPAAVLGRLLPFISMIVAFVAVVLLLHRLMPPAIDAAQPAAAPVEEDPQVAASSSNIEEYNGVEDKWLSSGYFTTGNKELDAQVKEFCDALTTEGSTARDNAQAVYNAIVWSDYEERTEDQKPSGSDWDIAAARQFFLTGEPAEGKGGKGDVYEFAAATSFCMRYFGFSDALAIPVLRGSYETGQTSSALVVVSDEYGQACVCDPTLLAEGWMLDRDLYTIVVENIEQDLTSVEALGLYVQQSNEGVPQTQDENGESDDNQTYDESYDYEQGYDYDESYDYSEEQ